MGFKQMLGSASEVGATRLFDIGGRPVTLSTLVTSLVVVLVAYSLSLIVQRAVTRGLERRGVPDGAAARVVVRLLHYAFVVVGVAVALNTAGIELGALFAAGAVFAVGIGFAMQNIAQNFVSGVILLVERTIKPGDILEVEGRMVRVVTMGIRATLVKTLDEEDMIVPNATLVQSTVKNYTLTEPLHRLRVVVGVTYGSDMGLVRRVLQDVAERVEFRDETKPPQVVLVAFAASSVDWELSVWVTDPWSAAPSKGAIREAIWSAFAEHDIVIAFPQLDVHLDPPVMKSLEGLARAA